MKRRSSRGFLLVFALLLSVLICLVALSMLALRRAGYASSQGAVQSVQARALARSGLSDIWTKLSKDPLFPAGVGDRQLRFTFREQVLDSGDNLVGFYTVVVDRSYRESHRVLRIESLGVAGSGDDRDPRYRIYAELSVDPDDFAFKVWEEGAEARL